MLLTFKNLLAGIVILLVVLLIIDAIRFYLLVRKGRMLAENAVPFERLSPDAEMKILVLGDSTAVGTGVSNPELSTAGRLGALYPEASVKNLAQNGLRLKGALDVLNTIDLQEKYSIILLQVGANDIIRLTSMKDIEKDADEIFAQLSKHTDKLVVLHSGNVGESKIFPIYTRHILSKRSYEIREIYKKLSDKHGARYVDLIDAPSRTLLRDHPETYYAEDFLHLSEAGYGLWFDEIRKRL